MTIKKWKIIKGFEGLYWVSDHGEVRNKKGLKNQRFDKVGGHKIVTLCKNGIKSNHKVHRLVAIAFLRNPKNLPMVNHEDGVKTHNHVRNLKWCNQSYNELHARRTGLKRSALGEKHGGSKLTTESIKIIRGSTTIPKSELARIFKVSPNCIRKIFNGETWAHV